MPTLDMRRNAVEQRQDLAYALNQRGLSHAEIADICGWSPTSDGIRRAIRAGERRAQTNAGRTSARRFGVEIEFNGTPRRNAVEQIELLDNQINCVIEGYNHNVQSHWKFITDGSVDGIGTGEGGLEAVSPILRGENGFAEMKTIVKGIKAAGGRVNRSCGLHVHHDANDMTGSQLAWLIEFYINNQTVIDTVLAPSRRSTVTNRWCKPWGDHEKGRMLASAKTGIKTEMRHYDRYRTINVTSYAKYGTIEFRQHQGSLNARKISAWIKFGQAMMETAIASDGAAIPTFANIGEMVNHLTRMGGLPGEVGEYLVERAEDWASEES
ncbi:carboxylate amine ligase [Arthrobacter phage Ottawa]|nr:carboxylate amine ligase [Arthrobacter phage Kharcho]WIC89297.1 carboxylate amine ligase [Arthrobacter phage Ottawa]